MICNNKLSIPHWTTSELMPPTNGLVLWLTMDNVNMTSWLDRSNNNNNGTVVATQSTITPFGYPLSFNGVTNYVDIPSSPTLSITDALTIEIWTNPTRLSTGVGYDDLLSKNNRYAMQLVKYSSRPQFSFRQSGVNAWNVISSPDGMTLNQWHHIVGTYNYLGETNNMNLYVDNILKATGTFTQRIDSLLSNLRIANYGTAFYQGIISEIRIYNRDLSPAEIDYNYKNSPTYYLSKNTI